MEIPLATGSGCGQEHCLRWGVHFPSVPGCTVRSAGLSLGMSRLTREFRCCLFGPHIVIFQLLSPSPTSTLTPLSWHWSHHCVGGCRRRMFLILHVSGGIHHKRTWLHLFIDHFKIVRLCLNLLQRWPRACSKSLVINNLVYNSTHWSHLFFSDTQTIPSLADWRPFKLIHVSSWHDTDSF